MSFNIGLSDIMEKFKDKLSVFRKGENSVENGHVFKMDFDGSLGILRGKVFASIKKKNIQLIFSGFYWLLREEPVPRAKKWKTMLTAASKSVEDVVAQIEITHDDILDIANATVRPPQQVDLFGGKPLGIFTRPSELKESPQIPTWQRLHQNDLKLAVTHPPANYFQQMILWTEQGKIWKFPIDNEVGLDEEKKVYFADHVFLEEHLEPWCPPKGPIRHFMELVCVGLSKNSYLTVEAKREHIEWYRKYFEDKRALLVEVGAIQGEQLKPKSIDAE